MLVLDNVFFFVSKQYLETISVIEIPTVLKITQELVYIYLIQFVKQLLKK